MMMIMELMKTIGLCEASDRSTEFRKDVLEAGICESDLSGYTRDHSQLQQSISSELSASSTAMDSLAENRRHLLTIREFSVLRVHSLTSSLKTPLMKVYTQYVKDCPRAIAKYNKQKAKNRAFLMFIQVIPFIRE
jgi:hypothetical protein